jgi:hypothetical protein
VRNRRTIVRFPVYNNYQVRVILARNVPRTAGRLGAGYDFCVACLIPDPDASKRRAWLVLPTDADVGTIAHESSHAIREMFKTRGVRNDDETFAYHLDFLVGRIHKFLRRAA